MQPDKNLIEPRFKDGIQRWIEHAIPGGGFLTCVLRNDLTGAIGAADSNALENIPHIVAYLYNACPSACWGGVEQVKACPAKVAAYKEAQA